MRIFVSYAHTDQELVRLLADGLHALGHDVWFDEAIAGGQEWWNAILAAIRQSDLVLAVISNGVRDSMACTRERGYALALCRPIIPVVLDNLRAEDGPTELAHLQMVAYSPADPTAAFRLAGAIGRVTTVPLPTVLPDPPQAPSSAPSRQPRTAEVDPVRGN